MLDSINERKTYPVQTRQPTHDGAQVNPFVYMAAYEVYCHVFSPQEALITGDCRGGFGAGELITFLYARSFPRSEWEKRVDEALKDMRQL